MARMLALGFAAIAALALVVVYLAGAGRFGAHEGPGVVREAVRPAEVVAATAHAVADAARDVGRSRAKPILFGDLHSSMTLVNKVMVGADYSFDRDK